MSEAWLELLRAAGNLTQAVGRRIASRKNSKEDYILLAETLEMTAALLRKAVNENG